MAMHSVVNFWVLLLKHIEPMPKSVGASTGDTFLLQDEEKAPQVQVAEKQ